LIFNKHEAPLKVHRAAAGAAHGHLAANGIPSLTGLRLPETRRSRARRTLVLLIFEACWRAIPWHYLCTG
jgi:hypothetical protein